MGQMLLAETTAEAIDFSPFITALTGAITVTQLLAVLASIVGVGMSFVLMWFGVRKAVGAFTAAVFGGRIRV